MRRNVALTVVIVVAMVALLRASPNLIGAQQQPDGELERFRAGVSFPAGPAPTTGGRCPALTVTNTGEGLATNLGNFTTEQSHCVDPQGADPAAFTDGEFTFTADGGTISGSYNGRTIPTETTDADGLVLLDVRFTIEEGTGDFAGVSGSGVADGLLNPETGEATAWLDGTWTGTAAVAGTAPAETAAATTPETAETPPPAETAPATEPAAPTVPAPGPGTPAP